MTKPTELQADDATRRALDQQLYTLVGRPVREVRITRVCRNEGLRWVALVIGLNGKEVRLFDTGLHHAAAVILREAFPDADWSAAQDYTVRTGTLARRSTALPAGLRGGRR
ncbi:hypothetical protein LZP81_31045 [Streptomyces parvulus]|uniref:hypothetical protein n=1 Tax=Streptomyces parvulus TaxID=146923 RepID=UPI001E2C37A1|nr:hypothetical protein [Streptomyces parvulus]MCC9154859.1 hypothetical protein [Streptomyces parvulus]MCE7691296.1 hypothetical protein [Streptomyces parvulus]